MGLFYAVMIGLNGGLGIELFVLLNYAVNLAGSAVVLSLLLCGIINILTMLSYCELGAAIPEVGGDYTFSKAAFGGLLAFLTGWLRWVGSVFTAALAATGLAKMVSNVIPTSVSLIAILAVTIFTVLSIRGIKEVDAATVLTFLILFAVFIITGFWHGVKPGPVHPPTLRDIPGFFTATIYTFTMFYGARAIIAAGSRIKNPGKNVPRAVLITSLVLVILYCSIAYVVIGVVPPELLVTSTNPLTLAAEKIMGSIGSWLLTIAGMLAAVFSLTTAMMVQSSLIRGLSRDGYLPKVLLSTHKRFKTPHVAIISGSAFVVLFAATGVIDFIGYVVGFMSLLGFTLVNLTLIKLRKERPHLERPFKAPLYPWAPIISILLSLTLLIFVEQYALALGIGFIILALTMYYLEMVGYHRLRVAIGGMNLSMGVFMVLLIYLIQTGLMPLAIPPRLAMPLFYGLFFTSAIYLIAGILNTIAKA